MNPKDEIAVIKKCEKSIYDYRRHYQDKLISGEGMGMLWAQRCLRRKRRRLERKL